MTDPGRTIGAEIERVHGFFVGWFAGDASRRMEEFSSTLAEEFFIVSPDGTVRDRVAINDAVANAFGTRSVEIDIANVVVRSSIGDVVFATYEERQAVESTRTARQSTVAMVADVDAPYGWRWLWVAETWMDISKAE